MRILNPVPQDYKSSALTIRPRHLQVLTKIKEGTTKITSFTDWNSLDSSHNLPPPQMSTEAEGTDLALCLLTSQSRLQTLFSWRSHENYFRANWHRVIMFLGEEDCMMSPKNVCIGGYSQTSTKQMKALLNKRGWGCRNHRWYKTSFENHNTNWLITTFPTILSEVLAKTSLGLSTPRGIKRPHCFYT